MTRQHDRVACPPVKAGKPPTSARSRYRASAVAVTTAVGGASAVVAIAVAIATTVFAPAPATGHSVAVAAPAPTTSSAVPSAIGESPTPTTTPSGPPPQTTQPKPPAPSGPQQPNTVRLPQGGTAKIVSAKIGSDGSLLVPDGVQQAALWGAGFDASTGATLLAGHINWNGAVGPFAELWGAKAGQQVTIVDSAGHTFRYQVSQILTLDKNTLPQQADELFGQQGPHRLVLATCGGQWVGGQLGYDENRVVIATPVAA